MTLLPWVVLWYAAASLVTFIAYGIDKRRAKHGHGRIPERHLHTLELLGGWPGALAGQMFFRHKWRKFSYMLVLAAIVMLHAAAWVAVMGMRKH